MGMTTDFPVTIPAVACTGRPSGKCKIYGNTHYHPETPDALIRLLEQLRESRRLVVLRYGDVKTGRDWLEENDVVGRIGRSTGICKIPLIVPPRSLGGPGMLEHCIVRILTNSGKRELYRLPNYHHPKLTIQPTVSPPSPKLCTTLLADGKVHALFNGEEAAQRWLHRFGLEGGI